MCAQRHMWRCWNRDRCAKNQPVAINIEVQQQILINKSFEYSASNNNIYVNIHEQNQTTLRQKKKLKPQNLFLHTEYWFLLVPKRNLRQNVFEKIRWRTAHNIYQAYSSYNWIDRG